MISIPAPYLRGLTVLTIGTALLFSHVAFAAPQTSPQTGASRLMVAVVGHDGEESLQDAQSLRLAENCYLEEQKHRTPQGKVVSRIVHECD